MIIDDRKSWKSHIKHVHNKLSLSSSVLRKAKHILDHKSLHILYCSLVLPYLNYCADVRGNTCQSKCTLSSPSILQKKVIGLIQNSDYRDHTNVLFLKLKKNMDLLHFQTAQIMCKSINNLLPGNF